MDVIPILARKRSSPRTHRRATAMLASSIGTASANQGRGHRDRSGALHGTAHGKPPPARAQEQRSRIAEKDTRRVEVYLRKPSNAHRGPRR